MGELITVGVRGYIIIPFSGGYDEDRRTSRKMRFPILRERERNSTEFHGVKKISFISNYFTFDFAALLVKFMDSGFKTV